jgi:outer membrane immunogenic protein
MKRFVLAGLGALAMVSMIGAANAADMGRRVQQPMPVKAAPAYAPYNWTGFYVGINGGGGWGTSQWSNVGGAVDFNTSGGLVGGTLGFNYQIGQTVVGLEGDLDWTNIRGSTGSGICVGGTCETKNSWLGTVRGRIGYAFDRFLPYLTGGLAVGDIKATPVGLGSSTETKAGWTLGGGLEFAVAGPWTAKVEYLYVDLGKTTCETGVCGTPTDVDFRANVVRAGLNYRF